MRCFPLLSLEAGSGRTFLAANLAVSLASLCKEAVLLVELRETEESELALYLGADLPQGKSGVSLICVGRQASPASALPASGFGFIVVDGLETSIPGWQAWLEFCGGGILVEKGDLVGARRASRLLKCLEKSNFPRQGFLLCFNQADPSQPLPEFPGLKRHSIPFYPRATERLAHAVLPSLAEPASAFSKAVTEAGRLCLKLTPMPASSPGSAAYGSKPDVPNMFTSEKSEALTRPEPGTWNQDARTLLVRRVLASLLDKMNLKQRTAAEIASKTFRRDWTPRVNQAAAELLAQENEAWLDRTERASLAKELADHVLGYGPLEEALADSDVSEIMVNARDQVYLERGGKLSLSGIRFWDDAQILGVIERIVAPIGRRIDESSPRVDARLPDGSRVHAIIPPLSLKGPCLTIRKFPSRRLTLEDLVASGSLTPAAANFLKSAVQMKKNMVVAGGTGSGKTTLLNVLSSFIPGGERIITIEDSAELRLDQPHVVSLETRPANMEGKGAVSIRDLVLNTLRMRPDRIVVGECRGGEALDMLQAMNTGHEGSLTTVHANSPRDTLGRLETLCLMSEVALPLRVIRSQIASAVDVLVQAARLKDGSRRITAIAEVTGMEGETIVLQDLFTFRQTGFSPEGRVLGRLEPTGVIPQCFHQAREAGVDVDMGLFS